MQAGNAVALLLAFLHASLPCIERVNSLSPPLFLLDDIGTVITDGHAVELFQGTEQLCATAIDKPGEADVHPTCGDAQFRVVLTM
jgi:hypothetical protein